MKKKVSIIVPTRNESAHIADTLKSIFAQDYPSKFTEVIIVDGDSDDNTPNVVANMIADRPNARLISNPEKVVPYALNYAIKASTGEIIIRMDSHSIYPLNYISLLVGEMNRLNSDNVGGVCVTLPANDGLVATGIALAISHPFGIGNSTFRIGSKDIREVDTVPFGCFKRSLFDKIGMFDTDLIRNQDDEFNGRIIKNGGKIHLIPQIKIKYFARGNVHSLMKMFYHYGLFKPLVNKKLGASATLRQFVPPLFTLFLVSAILLPVIPLIFQLIWACLLFVYLIMAFLVGATLAKKVNRPALFFVVPFLFPLIHVSYGWGYLKGYFLVNVLKKKLGKKDFAISR
ncbi:glycosyltransferase family 2 protein [Flavobacteriaceae bacterium TP-CH-4]|uniref:Glycosyltransferase family 2 protein n=1 Tax=Pelagihabitans pacificus TaxID=2696054 RepID=A0A967AVD5_9FLAO|nr:glycosyltransferase family 2 protein [Pelagihabitans pacificus]NHF61079.1 glycosyltransferase family 2 protein [Pelagihabitans pacificus]